MPTHVQRILLGVAAMIWLVIFALSSLEGIRDGAAWVAPVVSVFCLNLSLVLLVRRSPRS